MGHPATAARDAADSAEGIGDGVHHVSQPAQGSLGHVRREKIVVLEDHKGLQLGYTSIGDDHELGVLEQTPLLLARHRIPGGQGA